jgi:putative flippase GtrA
MSANPLERRRPSRISHLRWVQSQYGAKLLRDGGVSAFNVAFGQSLLLATQTVIGLAAVASNIVSVAVSAGPAYFLSRSWVWKKRGKNHFVQEIMPFWTLTFAGFLL